MTSRKRTKNRKHFVGQPNQVLPPPDNPAHAIGALPVKLLRRDWIRLGGVAATLIILGAVVYLDALQQLWKLWGRDPDYSHGYFVAPLAAYFLYLRRSSFPGVQPFCWWGIPIIVCAGIVRFLGDIAYVDALNAWSFVIWIAGLVCFLGGRRAVYWSMPALLFLFFMLPLPYRAERLLSVPLQRIATTASAWTLQTLGEPAIAEGNRIRIGESQFGVEDACSGLRIFVSILAVASAYLIVMRRPWWEKILLLTSVLPVALFANVSRVVITCIFIHHTSDEFAHSFSHDFAGYVMIPYAAVLFAIVLWYLRLLIPEVEQLDIRAAHSRIPEHA